MSHDPSKVIDDLILKKQFILLSLLKIVVLLNVFVECMVHFRQDSLMNKRILRT